MSTASPKHTREEGPSIWLGVNIDLVGPRCKEGIIGTHKEDPDRPPRRSLFAHRTRVTNAPRANTGASVSTG